MFWRCGLNRSWRRCMRERRNTIWFYQWKHCLWAQRSIHEAKYCYIASGHIYNFSNIALAKINTSSHASLSGFQSSQHVNMDEVCCQILNKFKWITCSGLNLFDCCLLRGPHIYVSVGVVYMKEWALFDNGYLWLWRYERTKNSDERYGPFKKVYFHVYHTLC